MVKIRSLDTGDTAPHGDETGFARAVFGDSLDFNRIRVTNLSGLSTRAFTTPTIDGTILLNIGNAYDSPTTALDPPHGYAAEGQILIHELTHAWQIQHASLADGYIPGLLCQGIYNQAVTGRAAYQYGPPGPAWSTFNLEAQAAIVDQWFAGNTTKQPAPPHGHRRPVLRIHEEQHPSRQPLRLSGWRKQLVGLGRYLSASVTTGS